MLLYATRLRSAEAVPESLRIPSRERAQVVMQVLQELGWRTAYEIFLSGAIAREVRSAYTDESSPKLRNLRTSAQIACGLKPGNSVQHPARTRVAHKAQLKLE